MTLARRIGDRPIVEHGSVPGYGAIFNAGLWHDGSRYHLFARGVRDGYRRNKGEGPRFLDYVSDILVFESVDGHHYEFTYVLATADDVDIWSYEDPRVHLVASNVDGLDPNAHVVMTYTRLAHPDARRPWQIGAHRLDIIDGRFHLDARSVRRLGPDELANKDAVIFNLRDGRVAMIHRIHPNMQVAVFDDLEHLWEADDAYWDDHVADLDAHTIIEPSPGALGVGAGAPPVETEAGLLLFYHERNGNGVYVMKVALLDSQTARVVAMLPGDLMVPELPWELEGDVDNVVFVQGAYRRGDGTIYLTYGAADRCVGAAVVDEAELLRALVPC
jgi:predicted GH43/DUF377 family glycosyl hydrolase